MGRILECLARTRTLLWLLVLIIAISIAFAFTSPMAGGSLLDMKLTLADNRALLAAMDTDERSAHIWATLTLDTAYPFAYGGALAGIAAHFSRRRPMLAAMPALLLILVDLGENMLILRALMGHDSALVTKVAATQLKWLLFGAASVIALGTSLGALLRHCAAVRAAEER